MIHGRFTEVVVSLTHATIFYSAATLAIQRFTEGFEKQTHKKGVLEDLGPERASRNGQLPRAWSLL
jgi:hypothetical protein